MASNTTFIVPGSKLKKELVVRCLLQRNVEFDLWSDNGMCTLLVYQATEGLVERLRSVGADVLDDKDAGFARLSWPGRDTVSTTEA